MKTVFAITASMMVASKALWRMTFARIDCLGGSSKLRSGDMRLEINSQHCVVFCANLSRHTQLILLFSKFDSARRKAIFFLSLPLACWRCLFELILAVCLDWAGKIIQILQVHRGEHKHTHTHLKGICTMSLNECCYGLLVAIQMEITHTHLDPSHRLQWYFIIVYLQICVMIHYFLNNLNTKKQTCNITINYPYIKMQIRSRYQYLNISPSDVIVIACAACSFLAARCQPLATNPVGELLPPFLGASTDFGGNRHGHRQGILECNQWSRSPLQSMCPHETTLFSPGLRTKATISVVLGSHIWL